MKRVQYIFDKPEVITIKKALEEYWVNNLKDSKVSDNRKVCKELLDDFKRAEEQMEL